MRSIEEIVKTAANGDAEAHAFLVAWLRWIHLIDDITDGDVPARQTVLVGRWSCDLFCCPFFQRYHTSLLPLIQLMSCTFEDSLDLESSPYPHERTIADVIRHTGGDMIRLVAFITGGYELMRTVSVPLRRVCYADHHNSDGTPK